MQFHFEFNGKEYSGDLTHGHDLSIALEAGPGHVAAWYVDPIQIEPVRANGWVGAVAEGGSVNFRNIFFNPHGHGTHTECLGHITPTVHSVNKYFTEFHLPALLVSATPELRLTDADEDLVITASSLASLPAVLPSAVIIRTLPNPQAKRNKNYSSSNPPYIDADLVTSMIQRGMQHLLIDLPSVDREVDGGVLAAHHAFWNVPVEPAFHRTITEMIYVADSILDGIYLLNLQVAPFENDASPSRPVIYPAVEV